MSTALTEDVVVQALPIQPVEREEVRVERTYNLHNLRFRLDYVGE